MCRIDRSSQACWLSFSQETLDQSKSHTHAEDKDPCQGEALTSHTAAYAISSLLHCLFLSGALAFLGDLQTEKPPPAFFSPMLPSIFRDDI